MLVTKCFHMQSVSCILNNTLILVYPSLVKDVYHRWFCIYVCCIIVLGTYVFTC